MIYLPRGLGTGAYLFRVLRILLAAGLLVGVLDRAARRPQAKERTRAREAQGL